MSIREITCTCCPLGCEILVAETENASYEYRAGALCGRGQKYAVAEATDPVRTLTASIYLENRFEPLSVKTLEPIPKALMQEAISEIKSLKLAAPVACGQVLTDNLCGTGISVVATKNLD